MQRRSGLALVALSGLLGRSGAAGAQGGERLRVAWDHYPPYQRPPRGVGERPQGLDIELAERIAARAGLFIDWQHMPWARQLVALRDGDLDLSLSASRVAEREDFALWTHPYRPERAALLGLSGAAPSASAASDWRALRGQRIGLIRGAAYPGEWAEALKLPDFRAQLVPLRHAEQGLRMLRSGRLDLLADDPVTLNALCHELGLPPLQVRHWIWQGEALLMLARRSEALRPGLLRRLNQAIVALRAEGALQALLRQHPELLETEDGATPLNARSGARSPGPR